MDVSTPAIFSAFTGLVTKQLHKERKDQADSKDDFNSDAKEKKKGPIVSPAKKCNPY